LCGSDPAVQPPYPLVRWFCAGVVPLALYRLVLYYQLALGLRWALIFEAVVVVLYLVALQLYHSSPEEVVACLSLAAGFAFLGGLALCLQKPPRQGGLDAEESFALSMRDTVE